jgi:spore coat protein I
MDDAAQHTQDLELGMRLMAENYPQIEVYEAAVIQGGGIKTIWKLETSAGTVCLKRIRKSIGIVHFTTAAQAYLAAKGALVAGILPTKDGSLYFMHEGYALVLYEWIAGGSDLEMEEVAEHLDLGLQGLARFQLLTIGFVPPEGSEYYDRMGAWPHHYEKMLEELKKWKQVALRESTPYHQRYLSMIDEMLDLGEMSLNLLNSSCYAEWVQAIGKYGYMCHQDYGKGNALYTERGVYVLDLDNLAYDIPLRDVRKLITKRMEELEGWDAAELERLVGVYTSVLPLTDDQLRILYIDMLFPHEFHNAAKKPFKKGEEGVEEKLLEAYAAETVKLPVIKQFLGLS